MGVAALCALLVAGAAARDNRAVPPCTGGRATLRIVNANAGGASGGADTHGNASQTSGPPSGLSLEDALAWLDGNAEEGGAYAVTVKNNETITPATLSFGGKTVAVTLEGGTTERTVSLNTTGSLFTVEKEYAERQHYVTGTV
jgi:hypothetical protein